MLVTGAEDAMFSVCAVAALPAKASSIAPSGIAVRKFFVIVQPPVLQPYSRRRVLPLVSGGIRASEAPA
jgi:hypothetical protein